jgi:hypothetical protein
MQQILSNRFVVDEKNGMLLSTTQKYDPYENAVAERINGILKYEFGLIKTLPNLVTAQKMLREAVNIYNPRTKALQSGDANPRVRTQEPTAQVQILWPLSITKKVNLFQDKTELQLKISTKLKL